MAAAGERAPLGRTVRTAREQLDLTQAELAERVGVSRAAIAEIEAGRIRQPRAAVFARLSAALGIPAAVLLASCYREALDLCRAHEIGSVAFPSISTGVYGYPVAEAAPVALGAVEHARPRVAPPLAPRRAAGPISSS